MSSRVNMSTLQKVVTENEIETGRISIPASVRDYLFPHLAENTKTVLTMVDENGNSYRVEIKLRENRTKPEIMAKGGRRFAVIRSLLPGTILEFSRSDLPNTFNVSVRPPQPAPPHALLSPPAEVQPPISHALALCSLSAQTQPPVAPHFLTGSFATAEKGFGLPICSNHQLEEQKISSSTTMLRFASFMNGPDHSLGEPEKPKPLELKLGLSLSSVQPPSPAYAQVVPPILMHMKPGLGLAIGSGDPPTPTPSPSPMIASLRFGSFMGLDHQLGGPPKPTTEMGLELSIGSGQSMGDPPNPTTEMELELSIGSGQSMGDSPKPTSEMGLELSIGSGQLMGNPTKLSSGVLFGSFIGLDRSLGEQPKRKSMKMEMAMALGLSIGEDQPPSPANKRPRFSLSISSENMQAINQQPANLEEAHMLDLTLALGNTHYPTTPPAPDQLSLSIGFNIVELQPLTTPEMAPGRIKSEAQEVAGGWYPDLTLSLESSFLHGPEAPYLNAAALAAGHDLQEPKPPTSLSAAKPGFSPFLPHVPLKLF